MTERTYAEVMADIAGQTDLASVLADGRVCAWCRRPRLEHPQPAKRKDWVYGNKRCRQAAHRFDKGVAPDRRQRAPKPPSARDPAEAMTFAYADPPYPDRAHLYADHPDGGRGEVDHEQLVQQLVDGYPDGWALSTRAGALQAVLALCPPDVRVASWTRRQATGGASYRPLGAWEPVIVRGGRPLAVRDPDGHLLGQTIRDAIWVDVPDDEVAGSALVYRGRYNAFPGALVGMKPPQFAEWMFSMLGARAGDRLDDLYRGSGAITEAWRRHTRGAPTLPAHLRP